MIDKNITKELDTAYHELLSIYMRGGGPYNESIRQVAELLKRAKIELENQKKEILCQNDLIKLLKYS